MAFRIIADDVRLLLSGTQTVPDKMDITPQIEMANVLVTEVIASVGGVTNSRLTIIEKLLAAHFVLLRMNGAMLQEVRLGDGTDQYYDHYGPGLKATLHGQQAIMMDPTNKLAEMSASAETPRKTAQFRVIGPGPNSGQTPVEYKS